MGEGLSDHTPQLLLVDAGLSIGDISHRLGFSEQSAFQRAFKRWTGVTPLVWRRMRYERTGLLNE